VAQNLNPIEPIDLKEVEVSDLQVKLKTGEVLTIPGIGDISFMDNCVTFSDHNDDEVAMIPVENILWIVKANTIKIEL